MARHRIPRQQEYAEPGVNLLPEFSAVRATPRMAASIEIIKEALLEEDSDIWESTVQRTGAHTMSILAQLTDDYPELSGRTIAEAVERAWFAMWRLERYADQVEGGLASLASDDLKLTRARMNAAAVRLGLPVYPGPESPKGPARPERDPFLPSPRASRERPGGRQDGLPS
jgi:hypothetical protein